MANSKISISIFQKVLRAWILKVEGRSFGFCSFTSNTRSLFEKIMRTPSDSYIARYTDIERTYKMHNIGAVPEFKMHNVRTVPTFKMHNIWTPMFYDICLELEFGLYSKKITAHCVCFIFVFYRTLFNQVSIGWIRNALFKKCLSTICSQYPDLYRPELQNDIFRPVSEFSTLKCPNRVFGCNFVTTWAMIVNIGLFSIYLFIAIWSRTVSKKKNYCILFTLN